MAKDGVLYGPDQDNSEGKDGHAGVGEHSLSAADVQIDQLSAEEQRNLKKRAQMLRKLLGDKRLAEHKIEVLFNHDRTNRGLAYGGSVVVWRSGSVLSGGGDELLYPCPAPKCNGYIGSEMIAAMSQTAYCVECKRVWKQRDLKEATYYSLDASRWAYVLAREFLRTQCKSDVYMKWGGGEKLRKRAMAEQSGQKGGEELFAARDARQPVMYSLPDIIKDVNAGSSIESRMRALITG